MPPRGVRKGSERARSGESRTRSRTSTQDISMNKGRLERAVDRRRS